MVNKSNADVSYKSYPETVNEISLKEIIVKLKTYCVLVLKKWKAIAVFAILAGIIGFVYAHNKKPLYIATTTFVLEDGDKQGGMLGQYSGLAAAAGIDIGSGGGGIFQGENILELYKSRSMLQKALLSSANNKGKQQLLVDRYLEINKVRENAGNDKELKNIRFDVKQGTPLNRLQDSVLGKVVEDINKRYLTVTRPDKKLSIIEVDVKSEDETFSKEFNDQIVKTVNDFYIQTKTKKSLQNLSILQHQTDSVRSVLNGAIFQSASVNDATPNLNPTRQILRAPAQRFQVNAEANKAILAQLVQNLELAKITLRKETPLIQVIDSPIYPLEKIRLGRIKTFALCAFLAGFLAAGIIVVRKIFSEILDNEGI